MRKAKKDYRVYLQDIPTVWLVAERDLPVLRETVEALLEETNV